LRRERRGGVENVLRIKQTRDGPFTVLEKNTERLPLLEVSRRERKRGKGFELALLAAVSARWTCRRHTSRRFLS